MRSLGLPHDEDTARVRAARRIIAPNDGFSRCLLEFEKELRGGRSGVYVPRPVIDGGVGEYVLPPRWAAAWPLHRDAELLVSKAGAQLERIAIGAHVVTVFGRSVTADVPCEHASISRSHCALVQHAAGGFCAVDLGSTHGTFVNGQRLLPHAEVRFAPGDALTLGASSRGYALAHAERAAGAGGRARALGADSGPIVHEMGDSDEDDDGDAPDDRGDRGGARARVDADGVAGGGQRKREAKWEKRSVRRLRQIVVPRALTENEKVALRAGMGSGCFGPG